MQRRTLISGIGSGIAGLGAGVLLLNESTESAAASVSMGELDVTGDQQTTSNGYINDLTATVSGQWSYELPGGEPDRWIVQLRVSDGDSWYTVGETSNSNSYKQYSGEFTVSGSIIDTAGFDTETFAAPGPGRQISVTLPLEVWFRVVDSNDTPLASTAIQDEATVTVGQEEIDASLYGEVSGEGSIEIS